MMQIEITRAPLTDAMRAKDAMHNPNKGSGPTGVVLSYVDEGGQRVERLFFRDSDFAEHMQCLVRADMWPDQQPVPSRVSKYEAKQQIHNMIEEFGYLPVLEMVADWIDEHHPTYYQSAWIADRLRQMGR